MKRVARYNDETQRRLDQTDPFARFARDKELEQVPRYRPSLKRQRLLDNPPTHCMVGGEIAVIKEHVAECLSLIHI